MSTRSSLKPVLFRLTAALLGVLACLAVAEMALRIVRTAHPPTEGLGPLFDRSPAVIYPHPSRLQPWTRSGDEPFRMAVIGDSITNGAGVLPDDTYGMRLERYLNVNPHSPPAEVRIYAKGGTSTFMQLRFLDQALEHDPKVVVLGICMNDTEDWTRRDELSEWQSRLLLRRPPLWATGLVRTSRLARWLYLKLEDGRRYREHFAYYRRIHHPDYSGHRRFVAALLEFQQRCVEHGAVFVAVVFPGLSWDLSAGRYPLQDVHDGILKTLDELDVPALDLLPAYTGKSPDRLQAIPTLDGHPNEIGHRIAAETLVEFLLVNHFVPPAFRPEHVAFTNRAYWDNLNTRMNDPFWE